MIPKIDSADFAIIPCPPYPEYKTQPADQSHCELSDCPICKGKMWLSEKKKGMLALAESLKKDIFLGCYDCIKKIAMENSSWFKESKMIKL